MTIKETLAAIKAANMHARWNSEAREYRVTFPPGSMSEERREEVASYTPDPQDALDTAKAMRAHFDALDTREAAIFTR